MRTIKNYVSYHTHSDYSLLDSCTSYQDYVNKAKELGQTALGISQHGNIRGWVNKKMACDAAGIKYLHAAEIYLTESLEPKVRDNFHTVLIAKNHQGFLELNSLVSMSTDSKHKYYVGRLSFDEFLNISENIIKTSACLASPLNKLDVSHPYYERLVRKYNYLEIQPHDCNEQVVFNRHLAALSQKYGVPLIAATDAHSLDQYKAECRSILMSAKHQSYGNEDTFDLTYKSYDQLCEAFRHQDALPEEIWLEAIENTNVMAAQVEEFKLDTSLKYPILYGSADEDKKVFIQNCYDSLDDKLESGVIPGEQEQAFRDAVEEEIRVFDKIGMCGFMQSMSELVRWCHDNGIVTGPSRGSVGGSRVAYVTDVIDMNPETWGTVFSRFANENRVDSADIDEDLSPDDRTKAFNYIIERFGQAKTAYVPACGTIKDKGCIEEIVRGLRFNWDKAHPDEKDGNPYSVEFSTRVKKEFEADPDTCRKQHEDIFYYYDGLLDTRITQSIHPAGIVISPITLADNYGIFWKDDMAVLQIDMDEIHEVWLIKYDLLGLKNIQIIRDTCKLAGIPYPKTHEIDWNDQNVWDDMLRSQVGVFEFESSYAGKLLKDFEPRSIYEMALVNACIRPSGASYRDKLIARVPHQNPSPLIDELLEDNNGYLVYQEDIIKFLQEICGLSGSAADSVRRGIARKKEEVLEQALPQILDGYCSKSDQPREVAEEEAKEFLQIIEDSSSYMFGKNHAFGYCLVGYMCAWLRYYHPHEFITAYLNCAANDDDVKNGTQLAKLYGIEITQPRFGVSTEDYIFDRDKNVISKGVSSVKFLNKKVPRQLYDLYHEHQFNRFVDVLLAIDAETDCDDRQITNLIKLDYFIEFGNEAELLAIYDMYKFFARGSAKTIRKEKWQSAISSLDVNAAKRYTDIIEAHSTDKGVNGNVLKSYQINDIYGVLVDFEGYIKGLNLKDVPIKDKINDQLALLGYIDIVTNKPADRKTLIILETTMLKGVGGKPWGVALNVRSIGTGNEARLTVRKERFNRDPIKKMDVIRCLNINKNTKGYWYLNDYEMVS